MGEKQKVGTDRGQCPGLANQHHLDSSPQSETGKLPLAPPSPYARPAHEDVTSK